MQEVQLSEATIRLIFAIAKSELPESVEEEDIVEAMKKIQTLIDTSNDNKETVAINDNKETAVINDGNDEESELIEKLTFAAGETKASKNEPQILIVDDVGIVTYQLKVMFEKKGFIVSTANDIYTAIKLFKNHKYPYIIMDLFVSTEDEGYSLLDEVKKIIVKEKLKTYITVITASNKAEHRIKCLNKGADKFIIKNQGWQKEIGELCNAIIGKTNDCTSVDSEIQSAV